MVHPWLVSLFLDCENAGLVSWPGSGWPAAGLPVLHCPNATAITEVREALRRGDLFLHAAPLNVQASYFPDASLFDASLGIAATLRWCLACMCMCGGGEGGGGGSKCFVTKRNNHATKPTVK